MFSSIMKIQFPWHIFTTLRVLNFLFGFFALVILSSGATMAAFGLMWIYPNPSATGPGPGSPASSGSNLAAQTVWLLSLVLTPLDTTATLTIGVVLVATFFAAIPALVSRGTGALCILNLAVTFDILGSIAAASVVWWRGLRIRTALAAVWAASPDRVRAVVQEQWTCCGYWSSTSLAELAPSGGCSTPELASARPACVDPFTQYAGEVLGGVSTFMYVMAGVLGAWFLVNACIIAERKLQKRFRLIEQKQDGMSFA